MTGDPLQGISLFKQDWQVHMVAGEQKEEQDHREDEIDDGADQLVMF